MRIKFVVGELSELRKTGSPARNGFESFVLSIKWRLDDDTGQIDLDHEDIEKITLYSRRGYRKRLKSIFGRALGNEFDWS